MAYLSDTHLFNKCHERQIWRGNKAWGSRSITPRFVLVLSFPNRESFAKLPDLSRFRLHHLHWRGNIIYLKMLLLKLDNVCDVPNGVNTICSVSGSLLVLCGENCSKCCRSYRDELNRLSLWGSQASCDLSWCCNSYDSAYKVKRSYRLNCASPKFIVLKL